MAVARNLTAAAKGVGRAESAEPPAFKAPAKAGTVPRPTIPAPSAPTGKDRPAAPTAQRAPDPPAASSGGAGKIMQTRQFADLVFDPSLVLQATPQFFAEPVNKSTTQIAQGAVKQLNAAAPAVIQEAVRTMTNKRVTGGQLLGFLERKTRIGEVLNDLAKDWDEPTPQDFAEAFQMPATADKFPVMDTIVSIAILNDPDLRNELEDENTTEPTSTDLMENRRIVWQWPEPGTPFTPPYLLMVAVEQQDTRGAQNVIQSILGDLVDFQGYKIPRDTVRRMS